ncbi:putative sodium/potassium/calcium exchanger [Halobellus limi]|jgi:predicted Zn-ribbon and HTH transcriptional regulator|uniref:CopG family transcriptional regulator n=1 Tax=Halobellus limi TaxID=699433 RepID=A0A1H5UCF5_9EURY|nr:CopG family transcriptional regulator [Halobellus limi]QCC47077.1 CopG family transcriptional regulator [Halobellus limi]SEF72736.1 hypothetical protein SAMN04488133_0554 [Halobellus limi]
MGSERVDGLPDELEAWVDDRAAATDRTREEVVRRLIAAHRELDEDGSSDGESALAGGDRPGAEGETAREADVESIERELDEVAERVAALEADLDEKITDVRERVIQVKRETDAKASAEHDHPEIERRLSAGFENYEEILEYLTDATDEHGSKLDRLGSAVLALRSRLSDLEGAVETREAAADLRREANRHGVAEAACESCGESVRLGLLDEPRCPHCDSPFDGLDPKTGFFGSNRLTVGDRPALEAGSEGGGPADRARDGPATEDDRNGSGEQPAHSAGEPSAAGDGGGAADTSEADARSTDASDDATGSRGDGTDSTASEDRSAGTREEPDREFNFGTEMVRK